MASRRKRPWSEVHTTSNGKRGLELHQRLAEANSFIPIQLQSRKIGLADFLHGFKVPRWPANCGYCCKTATHVLAHCH